jgi:hypothetical protein
MNGKRPACSSTRVADGRERSRHILAMVCGRGLQPGVIRLRPLCGRRVRSPGGGSECPACFGSAFEDDGVARGPNSPPELRRKVSYPEVGDSKVGEGLHLCRYRPQREGGGSNCQGALEKSAQGVWAGTRCRCLLRAARDRAMHPCRGDRDSAEQSEALRRIEVAGDECAAAVATHRGGESRRPGTALPAIHHRRSR